MKMIRVGIDLAKLVFQVHGVDAQEKTIVCRQIKCDQMLGFFKPLTPLPDRIGSLRQQAYTRRAKRLPSINLS